MTLKDFVGIPYETMNCWDIAVKFYDEILGIKLYHIYSGPTPNRDDTRNLIYSNKGEFEKVDIPQFGDIVLIKILGIESHIAVYVGEDKILHTSKSQGSVIDRLSRFSKRVTGVYRIKQND